MNSNTNAINHTLHALQAQLAQFLPSSNPEPNNKPKGEKEGSTGGIVAK